MRKRNEHENSKRILLWVIGITFLFTLLFSRVFIAENANHVCTGDNCPICACVQQLEETENSLITPTEVTEILPVFREHSVVLPVLVSVVLIHRSLVFEKIKMNN